MLSYFVLKSFLTRQFYYWVYMFVDIHFGVWSLLDPDIYAIFMSLLTIKIN